MIFEVVLDFIKKNCLHNVDILEKFIKDQALNKKYVAEKDYLKILRLPSVFRVSQFFYRDVERTNYVLNITWILMEALVLRKLFLLTKLIEVLGQSLLKKN